jgi:cation transporter-like permease
MSPYELLDLSQSNFSNSTAIIAVFLSLSFAYLAAAYFVGSKLTRSQVFILNTLYVIFAGITAYTAIAFSNGAVKLMLRAGVDPDSFYTGRLWMVEFVGICLLVAIFMCLKFMWDIRHAK